MAKKKGKPGSSDPKGKQVGPRQPSPEENKEILNNRLKLEDEKRSIRSAAS